MLWDHTSTLIFVSIHRCCSAEKADVLMSSFSGFFPENLAGGGKRFHRGEGTLEKSGKWCKVTAHICIYLYEDYNYDNPFIAFKQL